MRNQSSTTSVLGTGQARSGQSRGGSIASEPRQRRESCNADKHGTQPGLCAAPSHLRTGSSRPLGACLGRRGRRAARSPVIGLASARAGSMGAPGRGRLHRREQSQAARSRRLVGSLEELHLTPLWGTTGAGQLDSPSCSARAVSGSTERIFPTCQLLQCPGQVFAA